METTLNITDIYMNRLFSLTDSEKMELATKLLNSIRLNKAKTKKDTPVDLLDTLTGAWDDGTTLEEKMNEIRNPEHSLLSREVKGW